MTSARKHTVRHRRRTLERPSARRRPRLDQHELVDRFEKLKGGDDDD